MKRALPQPILTPHAPVVHSMKRAFSEPLLSKPAPAEQMQQEPMNRGPGLAPDVKTALKQSARGPDTTILVAGYSPTGGGHTARTLDIIDRAAERGTLARGSTVVLHVPQKWERNGELVNRPRDLETLARTLRRREINVVVAEADKSVIGYLRPDGSSDDPRILDRLADRPLRADAATTSVLNTGLYSGPGSINWQELEHVSISAKDLMATIRDTITPEEPAAADSGRPHRRPRLRHPIEYKVKVLTDMDPALQKAAKQAGVPDDYRLDQQNHGIMIRPGNDAHNLAPENAYLAKVLSGMGERVSHIGLGDKNPFKDLDQIAREHRLGRTTTKREALQRMSQHLIAHGNSIGDPEGEAQVQGVLSHPELRNANDVRNIVYVYAHNKTNPVAAHIAARIGENNPAYKDTLFVFCGGGALRQGNAMRIATLADADAITTAGAGTVGEFAFLARHAEARAEIMLLPIAGHNEQEENARVIGRDEEVPSTVMPHSGNLGIYLDGFIQRRGEAAQSKYENPQGEPYTLEPLLSALERETYVQQAHDLLFSARRPGHPTPAEIVGENYGRSERTMRENPVQKLNRKFAKMTLQVLNQIDAALENNQVPQSVQFKFNKKDRQETNYLLSDFSRMLDDNGSLTRELRRGLNRRENERVGEIDLNEDNLVGLADTKNLVRTIATVAHPDEQQAVQLREEIAALKELLGEEFKTGF